MQEQMPSDVQFLAPKMPNYSWMQDAIESLRLGTEYGERVTGEQLRERLTRSGLSEPDHPNAWGFLIRHAKQSGRLVPTGRLIPMRKQSSHARLTPEYVVARPKR